MTTQEANQTLSTKEAGELLGVHYSRVIQLINEGLLPARRFGRMYMLQRADVEAAQERPDGRGRPPKISRDKPTDKSASGGKPAQKPK